MAAAGREIYRSNSALWVPFATVAVICVVAWGSGWWEGVDTGPLTIGVLVLGALLLVAILFQGVLYWNTDVARLTLAADGTLEAQLLRWIGWGRVVRFKAADATGWRSIERHSQSSTAISKFSALAFTLGGKEYELSLITAERVDVGGLQAIAPGFMAKVLAEDPGFKDVGG